MLDLVRSNRSGRPPVSFFPRTEKAPFIDTAKVGTVVQIDFVFNKRKAAATAAGRGAADHAHGEPTIPTLEASGRRVLPLFVLEQPTLAVQSSAITGERAVRSYHAVAGHDDADRIGSIGQTHGPHGRRLV